MIFTHCGLLGDFLLLLPVASWYHKTHGEKVTFVLPDIPCFKSIDKLLYNQSFTNHLFKVPHVVEHHNFGGQPFIFNPADFGIYGEYINFGLSDSPQGWLTNYYAKQHGFGVDMHFVLNVDGTPKTNNSCVVAKPIHNMILVDNWDEKSHMTKREWSEYILSTMVPRNSIYLDLENNLYDNLVICKDAKHVYCADGGMLIALDHMNIDYTAYFKERSVQPVESFENTYLKPNNNKRTLIAVPENVFPRADNTVW